MSQRRRHLVGEAVERVGFGGIEPVRLVWRRWRAGCCRTRTGAPPPGDKNQWPCTRWQRTPRATRDEQGAAAVARGDPAAARASQHDSSRSRKPGRSQHRVGRTQARRGRRAPRERPACRSAPPPGRERGARASSRPGPGFSRSTGSRQKGEHGWSAISAAAISPPAADRPAPTRPAIATASGPVCSTNRSASRLRSEQRVTRRSRGYSGRAQRLQPVAAVLEHANGDRLELASVQARRWCGA